MLRLPLYLISYPTRLSSIFPRSKNTNTNAYMLIICALNHHQLYSCFIERNRKTVIKNIFKICRKFSIFAPLLWPYSHPTLSPSSTDHWVGLKKCFVFRLPSNKAIQRLLTKHLSKQKRFSLHLRKAIIYGKKHYGTAIHMQQICTRCMHAAKRPVAKLIATKHFL